MLTLPDSDPFRIIATTLLLALTAWTISAWIGVIPGQTPFVAPVARMLQIVGSTAAALAVIWHPRARRTSMACLAAAGVMLAASAILLLVNR